MENITDTHSEKLACELEADDGTEYRVTGPQRVHGTAPGDTLTARLDPGQEAFLIEVGHITPVRLAQSDATSADSAEQE